MNTINKTQRSAEMLQRLVDLQAFRRREEDFYGRPMMLASELYRDGFKDTRESSWSDNRNQCEGGCGRDGVTTRANNMNLCNECRDKFTWPKCITCGQLCSESSDNYFHIDEVALGNCFLCYHWKRVLEPAPYVASVRIEQDLEVNHYSYDLREPWADPNERHLGHGGSVFCIEYPSSGIRVTTNNLWSQGTMPAYWVKQFPVNARFVPVDRAKRASSPAYNDSFPFGIELLRDNERVETLWYDEISKRDNQLMKLQADPTALMHMIDGYIRAKEDNEQIKVENVVQ